MTFKHWHTWITAAIADDEPEAQRLSFDKRKPSAMYSALVQRLDSMRQKKAA